MSLVSSNPQPLAGRSEADGPLFEYALHVFYPNEGGRVTESGWSVAHQLAARLRDEAVNVERTAGVTLQASSAERSEEDLVSAIAESLRDFQFHVGPNTREALAAGKPWVYLTANERHEIAHAAVNAHKQVTGDE